MESYPASQVTPYGIKLLKDGVEPQITYTSPDGEIVFYLSGGLAPFMGVTEGVVLGEGIEGLSPPFQHLDHKGARQSGVTWSDTVYDPAEMSMRVTCTGQSPEGLRRVMRKWFAAWDPKKPGTLSVTTPEMGQWTCTPRLAKEPPEKLDRAFGHKKKQDFTWYIRNDSAFWQGPNSISTLGVEFDTASDDFNRPETGTLGPNWQQTYTGPGGGVCTAKNGAAVWSASDPDTFFTGRRSVVIGPFKDYSTSGDLQVVQVVVDNTPEFTVGVGAANHVWGRMGRNVDGSWNGYGVRATIGWGFTRISVFRNFTEIVLHQEFSLVPPIAGDKLTFYVGTSDLFPNHYSLHRNGYVVCTAQDPLNYASIGANFRGIGFGLQAGGAILTQASPANIRQISSASVVVDSFDTTTNSGLGPDWPLLYSSGNTGFVRAAGGKAVWVDTALGRVVFNRWLGCNETQTITVNGATSFTITYNGTEFAGVSQTTSSLTGAPSAATVQAALVALPGIGSSDVTVTGNGPYEITFTGALATTPMAPLTVTTVGTNSYAQVATTTAGQYEYTQTDNQVITVQLGTLFQFPFPDAAHINVFGRLNTNDATPTGVCMQISPQWVTLFSVTAGVWKVLKQVPLLIAPLWNETWTLTCGTAGNTKQFLVKRDGAQIINYTDKNNLTHIGSGYRNAGFGMDCGDGTFSQNIPPSVKKWSMRDNNAITTSGHLTLTNFGDQDAYPDYVVYGPGTFTFADGPGVAPTIEFGPLTDGQVALIRTDPGLRGVYDISTDQAEVTLSGYSTYIEQLGSLTVNNNIQPLMDWFQSEFGITPSQGNMYSLLKGRFSQPIPARDLSPTPTTCQVAVTIANGTSETQVIAALTPQRRWPL